MDGEMRIHLRFDTANADTAAIQFAEVRRAIAGLGIPEMDAQFEQMTTERIAFDNLSL